MEELIIEVKNIKKKYDLGSVSTKTFLNDLKKMFGKSPDEDSVEDTENEYWALKGVSFDVRKGEVLGIIGKNGAGKSTLLKILSRVTTPTSGHISVKGRVASLLEVGTGFHPDLSGRDNIFLNGSILGMKRQEIADKLDDIIEFAGIGRYIDTPVKRYSSGMYVRLAFAVAAHLEPDILVVDEVLAVGDADFQRKCMGKMKDVSEGGRTVLFVSHNLEAVKNLCTRAVLLEKGKLKAEGDVQEIVDQYLAKTKGTTLEQTWNYENAIGNEWVKVKRIAIVPQYQGGKDYINVKTPVDVEFEFWLEKDNVQTNLSLFLNSATGECIFNAISDFPVPILNRGLHRGVCKIPGELLNTGHFFISMLIVRDMSVHMLNLANILGFEVEEEREKTNWSGKYLGFVRPRLPFKLE